MELKFLYKGNDSTKIKENILNIYSDINKKFKEDLKNITICIHSTRNQLDNQLKRKTQIWEVANADHNSRIDMLHPDSFEKESSHSKEEFIPILKHEITHLFLDKISGDRTLPKWLDEGMASYVSDQCKNKSNQKHNHIEENFCEKLGSPQGWDKYSNYNAYQIASLFTYFLIEKHSFDKVKGLILNLDKNYYYPSFKMKFKEIFNKNIEETEKEFIEWINTK